MKVLHTSDWHLGQSLHGQNRLDEQAEILDYLLGIIRSEKIELLLVAGDIFHVKNPPNEAMSLYYGFLAKLLNTSCKNIVIIAGNHDAPSRLEAGKDILRYLNIFVVGDGSNLESQLIPIYKKEVLQTVVAAVPFLHLKDLPNLDATLSGKKKIAAIRQGIVNHYHELAKMALDRFVGHKHFIAMGHLFAKGAEASEKQDNIYMQDLENITADQFPDLFSYVALGHIHNAQTIGDKEHIRYSGSLLPLNFGERRDEKIVVQFDTSTKGIENVQVHKLPRLRQVVQFTGTETEVLLALNTFVTQIRQQERTAFAALTLTESTSISAFNASVDEIIKGKNIEVLKVEIKLPVSYDKNHPSEDEHILFKSLETIKVFEEKCNAAQKTEAEKRELHDTFQDLLMLYQQENQDDENM